MKKNLSWLFLANIIKGFYQWSLLVLIVKFLSTQDVGLFTLAYAITAPFFMFSNMQLKSIYVVDYSRKNYDFNYFIIRAITIVLTIAIVTIYAYFKYSDVLVILLVALIKAMESVFDIVHANFQKKEIMQYMSISIVLQSVVSLVVFSVVLYSSNNLTLSLLSIVGAMILVFVFYDFRIFLRLNKIDLTYLHFIKKTMRTKNNILFVKQLMLNAFPLGVAVFIGSYLTNLPRIYVEEFLGIEKLAYFGAMSYMVIGFFQLLLPIQIVLRPRLAKLIRDHEDNMFMKYLFLAFFSTVLFGATLETVFYIFGDRIISLIYNETYTQYLNILLWLIGAQIIITITGYLNIAIQVFHVFKLQLIISVCVLLPSIFFGRAAIQNYGIDGSVYLVYFYAILNFLFYFGLFVWKKYAKRY